MIVYFFISFPSLRSVGRGGSHQHDREHGGDPDPKLEARSLGPLMFVGLRHGFLDLRRTWQIRLLSIIPIHLIFLATVADEQHITSV